MNDTVFQYHGFRLTRAKLCIVLDTTDGQIVLLQKLIKGKPNHFYIDVRDTFLAHDHLTVFRQPAQAVRES